MKALPQTSTEDRIMPMSTVAISKVREFESLLEKLPQLEILTSHTLHAGLYCRSVMIPTGSAMTGVLIKVATMLIISGDTTVYIGDDLIRITGYKVIPASAHRKQAFFAHSDTYLTMIFPSDAKSIKEAEAQFTNESHQLISNTCENKVIITGE